MRLLGNRIQFLTQKALAVVGGKQNSNEGAGRKVLVR
jgi:hypothetical protein